MDVIGSFLTLYRRDSSAQYEIFVCRTFLDIQSRNLLVTRSPRTHGLNHLVNNLPPKFVVLRLHAQVRKYPEATQLRSGLPNADVGRAPFSRYVSTESLRGAAVSNTAWKGIKRPLPFRWPWLRVATLQVLGYCKYKRRLNSRPR